MSSHASKAGVEKPRRRGSNKVSTPKKKALAEEKPWEPRPWPKKGDGSKQTTYAAVGQAMSDWTAIEVALTRLFVTVTDAQGAYVATAARAFGSNRSFEGRLEMIKAAAEVYFAIQDDRLRRLNIYGVSPGFMRNAELEFKKLCVTLKDYVSRRNEFAHGIVSPLFGKTKGPKTYVLQPAPMDKKSDIFTVPLFAYGSKELRHYCERFAELAKATDQLNIKIRHHRHAIWQAENDSETQPQT